MPKVDEAEVSRIAALCAELDRRADVICAEITAGNDEWPMYGVSIARVGDTLDMCARVHHLNLIVRYGHQIERVDGVRVLKGIYRANIDDQGKHDEIPITWFSFDAQNNVCSPGDIIPSLVRRDGMLSIQRDFALLLAHDVQRHIDAGGSHGLGDGLI